MNKDEIRDQIFVSAKQINDQIEFKKNEIFKLQEEINVLARLQKNSQEMIRKTCFKNPKSGDVWHKNKEPLLSVVDVCDDEEIVICDELNIMDQGKYALDVGKTKKIKIQEFFKILTDNSNLLVYEVLPREYTACGVISK